MLTSPTCSGGALLHQPGDHLARVVVPGRGGERSPRMRFQRRDREPWVRIAVNMAAGIVPVLRGELADVAGRGQMAIGHLGHPREQSIGKEPSHADPAHDPAVSAIAGEGLVRAIPRQSDDTCLRVSAAR